MLGFPLLYFKGMRLMMFQLSIFNCRNLGLGFGGSWYLVTGVINKVTILIIPIGVLITSFTKSHDPPSD